MAPPIQKNNRNDAVSDTSSNLSTGTDITYDGGSESSNTSLDSILSPSRRSRIDSYLSSTGSSASQKSLRRRPLSSGSRSGSSLRSTMSDGSGSSLKSILKKKRSTPRKRRSLAKKSKSPGKKSKSPVKRTDVRTMESFSMIKNPVIRHQVRGFVSEYAKDPDFEAFSFTVDSIPFVALSLVNADIELQVKMRKAQPPTPMKKHAPGTNSPRKRILDRHVRPRSSSANSKCVRFTDEGASPKKAKLSAEDEEEIRELGETVSDAMIETDRQYHDLWNDRVNSVEK